MILAQDPFRQKSRKIYKSLYLKEDTTKQFNADPKDRWRIKFICEEGTSVSGNESEVDVEDNVLRKKSHFQCGGNEERKQQNNLSCDYSSGENTLPESDCSEVEGKFCDLGNCSYEIESSEYYCHACDVAECRKNCAPKTKSHGFRQVKPEKRRSSKEEFDPALKRFPPKHHAKGHNVRIREEKIHRCGNCNRHHSEEPRSICERKSPMMLKYPSPYKHVHAAKKERSPDPKWKGKDESHHRKSECCRHKQKIKVLDSYEELPVVEEALERRSDETYKASSYTKFAGDSQTNFPQDKTGENQMYERTPSWILCDKMTDNALNEALPSEMYPERKVKTRSRRTRIKPRRSIKWTKALVHPVVEGSRKEKVGVMILGEKGPEYYSKYSNKKFIPFRKTRSFPEGPTKSYDMPFSFESKEIFFSASDPGRKARSELRTPEEDGKIEKKISNFDKNIEELVKNMEVKFLESLSENKFQEELKDSPKKENSQVEEEQASKKNLNLMPRELLSSRAPKSTKFDRDLFAFNVESKMMAESLNERAKQFKLGQKNDPELEKKFPPKQLDKETRDANLTLWGMSGVPEAGGEGDGSDLGLRISLRRDRETREVEEKAKEVGEAQQNKDCSEKEEESTAKKKPGSDRVIFDLFRSLVKDGSAITEKESEKLQKILQNLGYEPEPTSSEIDSKTSDDTIRQTKDEESKRENSNRMNSSRPEDCQSDVTVKNVKNCNERKWKHGKKPKRQNLNLEKLKVIREALPSMAAENEAAHLKQLKKYIQKFIDGIEHKISSSSEVRGRRRVGFKPKDTTSSDSSEVKVDARKLIDLVSNPFKRITSDMTIDMAKKLTDALVQENASKIPKNFHSKTRKNSEGTQDASLPCPTTSGSDGEDEVEPKYLERLKKMRNDHLSNIVMEVRRLRELIRFLDRCNRLKP